MSDTGPETVAVEVAKTVDSGRLRTFASGATRDTATNKIDPEGFFDPLVVAAFSGYMDRHRKQSDGGLRASDNWQAGFTRNAIIKSMWRHFLDLWLLHRGHSPVSDDHRAYYESKISRDGNNKVYAQQEAMKEILCALYFNVGAYLREVLLGRSIPE